MRLSRIAMIAGIILLAAVMALIVALVAVNGMESSAKSDIESRYNLEGIEHVSVETDGLQVTLSGTVSGESERFRAITAAGKVVDSARIVDQIEVAAAEPVTPPRFSVEILRNDQGVSLIGLIPADTNHKGLSQRMSAIAAGTRVADLLETANYPKPANWDATLDYALDALEMLERSKISMADNQVSITAIAASAEEKGDLEAALARAAPGGLDLTIQISAPRPVIAPFNLRFVLEKDGSARFDACSAHTEEGREVILAAARAVGVTQEATCKIGLGVPSADWPQAVATAIGAVADLQGGAVTFSDADVTLVALDTTAQADFDRVTGELENALPEVFSLHAVLPKPVVIDGTGEQAEDEDGAPEFVATLSPEGQVQLRGRVGDEIQRDVTASFSRARFGIDAVYVATRLDPSLPADWPTRVLAGLESLSLLSNGVVVVQPELVDIRGNTGNIEAGARISQLLSEKLGEAQDFRVNIVYQEKLDPVAAKPSAAECANAINEVLETSKITFAPGSADIVSEAHQTVDKIAEIMKDCQDIAMEIGGFTDSQGREEMNQALSQNRAQAVLNALLARRVLTTNLVAHGYGEAKPIADNDTEEGREANRRIEFRLILPEEEDAGSSEADGEAGDGPEAMVDAETETGSQAEETAGSEIETVEADDTAAEAADTDGAATDSTAAQEETGDSNE